MKRVALLASFVGLLGCGGAETAAPEPKLVATDSWCPDGFEQSSGDNCFALPEHATKDTPVLVYLHAMFAGRGAKTEWDAVRGATKRGFAVVLPRGKRGACAWKAEVKDYFCWPDDAEDIPEAKRTVAEWEKVLWQVEALMDPGTHRRYVLGSGNGGAFAELLATQALFPAAAYAIIDGVAPGASVTRGKTTPLLLVAPEDDRVEAPKLKDLHDALAKAGWNHAWCPRPGAAALSPDDVDTALRFFKRESDGTLKGAAPYACR